MAYDATDTTYSLSFYLNTASLKNDLHLVFCPVQFCKKLTNIFGVKCDQFSQFKFKKDNIRRSSSSEPLTLYDQYDAEKGQEKK